MGVMFGWRNGRGDSDMSSIAVRFDVELMKSLKTMRYSDYLRGVIGMRSLSEVEASLPMEELAEKYPLEKLREWTDA